MAKNRGGRGGGQMNRNRNNPGNNRQGRPLKGKVQSQQFRLQRSSNRDAIEKNLIHLQQNLQKKKKAQAMYYSSGRTPLKAGNSSNQNKRIDNRSSVHNRLGNNSGLQTKRRGTNTRIFNNRNTPSNGVLTKKTQRFNRQYTAQARIQRIRQGAQSNRGGAQTNQARNFNDAPVNLVRKQIQLQRNNRPQRAPQPTNVTVKVDNPKAVAVPQMNSSKHSVNAELDPRLQAEIRMIQSTSSFRDSIPAIPIHPQGAGVTKSSLHERFSML